MKIMGLNKCVVFVLGITLLLNEKIYSQECKIFKTGRKTFYFADTSILNKVYLKTLNDSTRFNILLLSDYGSSNQTEIKHISIESSGEIITEIIYKDSSIITNSRKLLQSDLKKLLEINDVNGFFETACKNSFSHNIQVLIVSNPQSKKWIELTCLGVGVKDILKDNSDLSYLNDMYNFLDRN